MAYKNIDSIIVNTACNLFIEKGYANVSVNEICSGCSITKPTLYYHFKSKEDILYSYFCSMIDDCADLICGIEDALPLFNGRHTVIQACNILFYTLTSKGYDMTQNLVSGCLCDIGRTLHFPEKIKNKIIEYIYMGQKDGSIASHSAPEILYSSLNYTLLGYILNWCMHNGLTEAEETVEKAVAPLL